MSICPPHHCYRRVLRLTLPNSGLRLAEARRVFIIGYSVLAAGVFIIVMMIQLCIFCCLRKREVGSRKSRKSEESNESHQMDRYK